MRTESLTLSACSHRAPAAAASCSTMAAFCWVMPSMWPTAACTSAMLACCSWAAWLMPARTSVTSATDCTASRMRARASSVRPAPWRTWSADSATSCLICWVAAAVRWASVRTSVATTAKPRPASPARAASTAAFSASRLVWNATDSIRWMISPMWLDEAEMSAMAWAAASTAASLRPATAPVCPAKSVAWLAACAPCPTLSLMAASAAAICCRLPACASVRADRSWLPAAISCALTRRWSTSSRTSRTTARRLTASCARACCSWPTMPDAPVATGCARSPAASWLASRSTPCRRATVRRHTPAVAMPATSTPPTACPHSGRPAWPSPSNMAAASSCSPTSQPRLVGVSRRRSRPRQSQRSSWP